MNCDNQKISRTTRKTLWSLGLWKFKSRRRLCTLKPISIPTVSSSCYKTEKEGISSFYKTYSYYTNHKLCKKITFSKSTQRSYYPRRSKKNNKKGSSTRDLNLVPFDCDASSVPTKPLRLTAESENKIEVIKSKPDGHCLLHSILSIYAREYKCNISLSELSHDIRREFYANIDYYSAFNPLENLHNQLEQYLNNNQYNSSLGDMMPLIISNVIKQEIHIYNSEFKLVYSVKPRITDSLITPKAFKVILRSEHYDALITNVETKRKQLRYRKDNLNLINIPLRRSPQRKSRTIYPNAYILNIQSLSKPHALQQLAGDLLSNDIDVAFITETHLKQHHDDNIINIEGYKILRKDRIEKKAGGVALIIKNEIQYEKINIDSEHEILWTKADVKGNKFVLAVLYHPPKKRYSQCIIEHLEEKILHLKENLPDHEFIIGGDFNELNEQDISERTGLVQIVKEPTRQDSILDHIYISYRTPPHIVVTKSTAKSDHQAVILLENRATDTKQVKNKITHSIRIRKPKNIALMKEELAKHKHNLNFPSDATDFQKSCDALYSILLNIIDKYAPTRQITVTSKDPKYVTPIIKSMLRRRNKLMRSGKAKKAATIAEKVKSQIIKDNCESLKSEDYKKASKEMWSKIKELKNRKPPDNIPIPNLTAQNLNDHYTETSTDMSYQQPESKQGPVDNLDHFDEWEVYRSLSKLKKTATGPDNLPSWFLKLTAEFIAVPITTMINISIKEGLIPEQWKSATITPIPKVNKATKPIDFRPISVTSVLSRMTEKMIATKYVIPATQASDKFSDQFAFRPFSSTTAAIIANIKEVINMLETSQYVRLIQLDFSKAFDTVRHYTLFEKVGDLHINSEIYNWLLNFFTQHRQRTKFQGELSRESTVNCGVIQGSALGPIMFTILASDLQPMCPGNKIIKYADDTDLIIPRENISKTAEELNHINEWSKENNLNLNHKKSKEIIFKRPRCKEEPEIIDNIKRVNEINLLGITVTDKLQATTHINTLVRKCNSNLYAIRTLKRHGLQKDNIHNVYSALILGKITYAISAWWGLATFSDRSRLIKYINRSIRHGFCDSKIDLGQLVRKIDKRLLKAIERQKNHPLRQYLTFRNSAGRTRERKHGFQMPLVTGFNKKDFIVRTLHDL